MAGKTSKVEAEARMVVLILKTSAPLDAFTKLPGVQLIRALPALIGKNGGMGFAYQTPRDSVEELLDTVPAFIDKGGKRVPQPGHRLNVADWVAHSATMAADSPMRAAFERIAAPAASAKAPKRETDKSALEASAADILKSILG